MYREYLITYYINFSCSPVLAFPVCVNFPKAREIDNFVVIISISNINCLSKRGNNIIYSH